MVGFYIKYSFFGINHFKANFKELEILNQNNDFSSLSYQM